MAIGTGERSYVDTNVYEFRVIDVDIKKDRDGVQKKSRDEIPAWTIDVMRTGKGENEGKDAISVTVYASQKPDIDGLVTFEGLVSGFYSMGNRSGVFFTADSVKTVKKAGAPAFTSDLGGK